MKEINSILSDYGTTIFTVMSALAADNNAINLGQGFPDKDGPADVLKEAIKHIEFGSNQYPPMMGIPELRDAAAEHAKIFYDLNLNWETQCLITSGATEAIAASLLGLINQGDEVVLLEPLYDCYLPILRRAGGIPKLVRLSPPNWQLPYEELERAFSGKTKLILLNSPTNPAGKVFSRSELDFIASLIKKFDAYAVCDEVYEHMTYDGLEHIPLITLPGMAERCIRISSAGKTFSMTGWKVGYSVGAPELIDAATKAHQFLTFTVPPNLQMAVAYGLRKEKSFFLDLGQTMELKRDILSEGLQRVGFNVVDSQGTYFLSADFRPLDAKSNDIDFCKHLTTKAGVAAVPFSAFYQEGLTSGVDHFIRFCFCKKDEVLRAALKRLESYFNSKSQ